MKIRPVYHWTPRRIEAHIAIAFMAFVCVHHLEYRVIRQKPDQGLKEIRCSA